MTGRSSSRATTVEHGAYTIRPYDSGDADGVRALFETVWGSNRSAEWIAHRYEANPYRGGPPMIVAERDGEIVGARPFVPFPVRAGGVDTTALYFGNVMVHPDHRRQGLFRRMTVLTGDAYGGGDVAFCFNFANELSAPVYRDLGFEAVGVGPEKRLRIQRPGRLVRDRTRLPVGRRLTDLAAGAAAAVLARLGQTDASHRWRVEREAGVAAALFARIYDDAAQPGALHTRREELLYRWLGDDPYWQYETYVASPDATPAAAVLVRRRRRELRRSENRDRDVWIVDAVPPAARHRRDALRALLDAVVSDYRDARVLSVTGPVVYEQLLPVAVLREFGFLSSTLPGLDRVVGRDDTVFVQSLPETAKPPSVGGFDLRDPENWAFSVR